MNKGGQHLIVTRNGDAASVLNSLTEDGPFCKKPSVPVEVIRDDVNVYCLKKTPSTLSVGWKLAKTGQWNSLVSQDSLSDAGKFTESSAFISLKFVGFDCGKTTAPDKDAERVDEAGGAPGDDPDGGSADQEDEDSDPDHTTDGEVDEALADDGRSSTGSEDLEALEDDLEEERLERKFQEPNESESEDEGGDTKGTVTLVKEEGLPDAEADVAVAKGNFKTKASAAELQLKVQAAFASTPGPTGSAVLMENVIKKYNTPSVLLGVCDLPEDLMVTEAQVFDIPAYLLELKQERVPFPDGPAGLEEIVGYNQIILGNMQGIRESIYHHLACKKAVSEPQCTPETMVALQEEISTYEPWFEKVHSEIKRHISESFGMKFVPNGTVCYVITEVSILNSESKHDMLVGEVVGYNQEKRLTMIKITNSGSVAKGYYLPHKSVHFTKIDATDAVQYTPANNRAAIEERAKKRRNTGGK